MSAKDFVNIHTMIQQDLTTCRQLLSLLEKETESTQNRDYSSLARLVEQKIPLLEQLKENAHTRCKWLISMGKNTDEEGWLLLLKSTNNQHLHTQWNEIKKTIEHCQRINNINGKLIMRGAKTHSRLLNIMRGNTHQANVYTAKGVKYATTSLGRVTQA